MAEVPLVVVDIQRGGPSAGLPDRRGVDRHYCFGGHATRVVLARPVEDCFYTARRQDIARRYGNTALLVTRPSRPGSRRSMSRSWRRFRSDARLANPTHKPYDLETESGEPASCAGDADRGRPIPGGDRSGRDEWGIPARRRTCTRAWPAPQ